MVRRIKLNCFYDRAPLSSVLHPQPERMWWLLSSE